MSDITVNKSFTFQNYKRMKNNQTRPFKNEAFEDKFEKRQDISFGLSLNAGKRTVVGTAGLLGFLFGAKALQKKEEEISEFEKKLNIQEKKIRDIQDAKAEYESNSVQPHKEKITKAEKEKEKLENEKNECEVRVINLKKEEKEITSGQNNPEISEIDEKIQVLRERKGVIEGYEKSLQGDNFSQNKSAIVEDLKSSYEEIRLNNDTFGVLNDEKTKIQSEIDELEDEKELLIEYDLEKSDIKTEILKLKNQITDYNNKIEECEKNISELRKQISDIMSRDERISEFEKELNAAKGELYETETALKELKREIKRLNDKTVSSQSSAKKTGIAAGIGALIIGTALSWFKIPGNKPLEHPEINSPAITANNPEQNENSDELSIICSNCGRYHSIPIDRIIEIRACIQYLRANNALNKTLLNKLKNDCYLSLVQLADKKTFYVTLSTPKNLFSPEELEKINHQINEWICSIAEPYDKNEQNINIHP